MRKLAGVVVLLVSPAALASGIRSANLGHGIRSGGMSRLVDMPTSKPLFEFLPASGAGAPVASDLCDAVTTDDKAGNWWCLKGDGTMATGSAVTLSAVGSPTTQTRPLCSNGLQCADATHGMTDGTSQYWATSSGVQSPTGDFSGCVLAALWKGAVGDGNVLLSLDDNTAGNRVLLLNDAAQALVFKSDGTSSTATKSLPGNRMRTLACFTYDYVADGSSVLTVYVDGVAGTPLNTAVGPPASTTGARWSVSARRKAGSADALKAIQHWGSFVTHKVLSAADVARLSAAVHGTLTGSRGEAVTFTRSSAQTCDNGSGAVTVLPAGRPCVAQGGYLSEGSATNLLLRSEELDNASWSDVGTPATSANGQTGVDGTLTGDTLTDNDAAALEGESQSVASTSQTKHTLSCWMKAGTATEATLRMTGTGNSAGDQTCTFTSISSSAWDRKACTSGTAYGAGITNVLGEVLVGDAVGDTGTLHVWGCQLEARSFASSYIRTEGSTATRVATKLTGTKPTAVGDGQGCMAATVKVPGVTAGARAIDWNAGYSYLQSTTVGRSYDSTNTISATAGSTVVDRYVRLVTTWTGSTLTATHDGVSASGSYDGALTGSSFFIGSTTTPDNHLNGFVKQVEVDSSLTRCDQ